MCMRTPSVALGEGFLVHADAFSIDHLYLVLMPNPTASGHSPVLPYTEEVSVAPSDLCIMRDRPREVWMVSSC